ncbi:MAG: ComEC/Rec2 family competence protein [Rikenellaceae bacterium]
MDSFIFREINSLKEKLLLVPIAKIFFALLVGIVIGYMAPILSFYALIALLIAIPIAIKLKIPYSLLILLGLSLHYLDAKEEKIPQNVFLNKTFNVVEVINSKSYVIDLNNERLVFLNATPLQKGDLVKAEVMVESLKGSTIKNKTYFLDLGIDLYAHSSENSETLIIGTATPKVKPLYNTKIFFRSLRDKLVLRMSSLNIDKNDKAIVKAITLGDTRGIRQQTKTDYASCGVSHILSISGLHISVIFIILNAILLVIPNYRFWRTTKVIFIISMMWFYVFVSGSSPSAMRSAFMLTLLQFCYAYVKSRYQMYNILFASAVFFLLIDHTLLLDVGFQLSYLALFAILFLYYRISLVVRVKNKILNNILSIILISISIQIITTPFVTYYFGVLSLTGLLANIVFTSLLPILMWASLTYLVIPNALSYKAIESVMYCYNISIEKISALPLSSINNYYTSTAEIIAYFILFVVSSLYLAYFYKIKQG